MRQLALSILCFAACGGPKPLGASCAATSECAAGLFCLASKCEEQTSPAGANVTVSPTAAEMFGGGSATFKASVAVNWKVAESGGGTVTSNGVYTAPSTPGMYHVIAVNQQAAAKTATATITVDPALQISPASNTIALQGTADFTASLPDVTWSVDAASGATISAGHLVASTVAGTFTVTATPTFAPSGAVTAKILIKPSLTAAAPLEVKNGDTVTLTGVGFGATQGTSSANFDGVPGGVVSWSDTSVQVTAPADSPAVVSVTVGGVDSDPFAFWPTGTLALPGNAGDIAMVSDGAGGGVITQVATDNKTVTFTHVSGLGIVDPNAATFTAGTAFGEHASFSDGAGGVFFVYEYSPGGSTDYLSFSAVSAAMTITVSDTTILSFNAGSGTPYVAPDGSGGAFVALANNGNTVIQHVDATGAALTGGEAGKTLASQSVIGIFRGASGQAYAVTVNAAGTGLSRYLVAADGTASNSTAVSGLAILAGTQPLAVSDGSGGAFLLWYATNTNPEGFVEHIDATHISLFGAPKGVPLSIATPPGAITGGTILATATSTGDLDTLWLVTDGPHSEDYARQLEGDNGTLRWSALTAVDAPAVGTLQSIAATSDNGIFVGLNQTSTNKILAQKVTATGAFSMGPSSTTSTPPILIPASTDSPSDLCMVGDAAGGAILAWIVDNTIKIKGVSSSGAL